MMIQLNRKKLYVLLMIISSMNVRFIISAQPDGFKKTSSFPGKNWFAILTHQSCEFNDKIRKFSTHNNRIKFIAGDDQKKKEGIVKHAQNSYPLIHEKVLVFMDRFLEYKKNHGTSVEKILYKNMSLDQFIMRLLINRPLMFMTESDQYILRDGKTQGHGGFEAIGTELEKQPLVLNNYLSYDEMEVAALIGMSVPTYFINNGARDNKGINGADKSYEEEGIYVGLVGARFEKPGLMEWQHMIATAEQNTVENGYGREACDKGLLALWSELYGEKFLTFKQSGRTRRYDRVDNGINFDERVYRARMRLVIEPFLRDAHNRAIKENKKAYVHVVGLGLGVWQIYKRQAEYMLIAYAEIIENNNLSGISDIDFSWFPANAQVIRNVEDGQKWKGNNDQITIHFSQRNPADKLVGKDEGKLLVASYAWDGNAYPGNEYWAGMLTASGDPAAACCSTIAELQNPLINRYIKENVKKMFSGKQNSSKNIVINAEKSIKNDSLWQRMNKRIKIFFGW